MPINEINNDSYFDLLVDNTLDIVTASDDVVSKISSRYSIVHMRNSKFEMCLLGRFPYHVFPTLFTLSSEISLGRSGVNIIQNNPNLPLYGQGVMIGFLDTGIDYQHPAFLNADGSTRLFSIWDQTIADGTPPEGFTMGAEYNKTTINMALLSTDPLSAVPSVDEEGHGTMLAGIAAGSRIESENFSGVAPEADLIVVKLAQAKRYNRQFWGTPDDVPCYPETNILLAIQYIVSVASRLDRPLVLCVALGSNQGANDGNNALSVVLNNLALIPRVAVCVAAGNEGNKRRHLSGTFTRDERARNIELRVGDNDPNFSMEVWKNSPARLLAEIVSPTGEVVRSLAPGLNRCVTHQFLFAPTNVFINNITVEDETGEQLILFRFQNALPGIWNFRISAIDSICGEFNAWLPSGDLITTDTYFLESDPYITIAAPGNAPNPLTVTAYNQLNNSILAASSRGPTVLNSVKPDIAAPGFALPCPIPNQLFATATGTGAAAAHASGIASMLLEWAVSRGNYTSLNGRDVNRILIRGARRDADRVYPNSIWGYGQLDIYGSFVSLI